MENKTTLNNLKIGQHARIFSIENADKALKNHILNMGLTIGSEIELIKIAPLGDPMEFRIRGYELTLRKETASKIFITNIHESDFCPKDEKPFKETEHSRIGENQEYIQKKNKIQKKTKIELALLGNQNCGKTTLFNKLTGSNQHVGNFPGVTIDKKEGQIIGQKDASVVDLPGVYSLLPYSKEEIITRDYLIKNKPDGIINIIDATNIERNLYLTIQLLELEIPMVIALNMMDEVKSNNGNIDINGLENLLKVPVIPISAVKDEGIEELIEHATNVARYVERPSKMDFCLEDENETCAIVHRLIHSIMHRIENHAKTRSLPLRYAALEVIEGDKEIIDELKIEEGELDSINNQIKNMEEEINQDATSALATVRFNFIEKLCDQFISNPKISKGFEFSTNLDKILTGKYTALPTFFVIMAFILYMSFGPFGTFLSESFEKLIAYVISLVNGALLAYGLNEAFRSLIVDGALFGIGSVLGFLPTIVILFFFLSVLEDSGYMARVAFIADRALRKIGLSGRSFVPMLIGFGCSVPAIMATRTLPSERDRRMTIFLVPFMSCSAKLPIYALFCAAFFKENRVLIILSLYLIGVLVGVIFSYIIKFFVFKGKPVPFVMELPNYRFPSFENVSRLIYTKSKDFVQKAFTIIFVASIFIWFMQTFDLKLNLVLDAQNSILAYVGNILIPIFKPLGITDWRISTAFLTGFMAKESIVSTLSVLVGSSASDLAKYFTPHSAFVFLVFCLLYTPCIAAIATVKRELGNLYAFLVVLLQCSIAWVVALIVHLILK